jgi:DNA polymerase
MVNRYQQLAALGNEIQCCEKCTLHRSRTQVVLGDGDPYADLMLIGEAPGKKEDEAGKPFVGMAGQMLSEMLAAAGVSREQVYVTNVVKARPPDNRKPLKAEIAACLPFLHKEIEIIQPRLICTLGRPAAHALLETRKPLSQLRGTMHHYKSYKLVATYHPASVRRFPASKEKAGNDMQMVRNLLT